VNGAAIAARGLGKRFGRAVALAELDLDVPAGGSLAVLGPNGAGKSTLLRLMAGLARPTAGSLAIGGTRADRREARAQVGYLGHATLLYPTLTARENLLFAARLYDVGDAAARCAELLAEEGLAPIADLPVASLSLGMAQRVAIARGLVHDPSVLLLDEPFTGLDRRAAERLTRRLEALRRRGCTIVLVTHDVERAAHLADAAVVLARGRIAHQSFEVPDPAALERAYLAATDSTS
jgi:heme exporter protein A